ncbi:MAG: aldolase [Candidatus Margulisiibacteriota bacterium]
MLEQFQLIGKLLFDEGLVHAGAGNLSIRRDDKIFITRTGSLLSMLKEGDIIEVGMEKGEADKEASVELPVHRAVYKGSKAQAIVHAHPAYAIALSLNEEKIIPQDAEGKYFIKSIPVVKVREAIGSDEVARFLPPVFGGGYHGAIVRGHGSYTIGADLMEAYKLTSTLENSCKIIILSRKPAQPQTSINKPRDNRRGPAIPPGIGVMDRSRYNRR